ncbi:MAG TPA: hypothetical protein VJB65_03075 [Patescibacteria group bacterium]|nr:hypothetical protein [Patescibacteria group bacterium]
MLFGGGSRLMEAAQKTLTQDEIDALLIKAKGIIREQCIAVVEGKQPKISVNNAGLLEQVEQQKPGSIQQLREHISHQVAREYIEVQQKVNSVVRVAQHILKKKKEKTAPAQHPAHMNRHMVEQYLLPALSIVLHAMNEYVIFDDTARFLQSKHLEEQTGDPHSLDVRQLYVLPKQVYISIFSIPALQQILKQLRTLSKQHLAIERVEAEAPFQYGGQDTIHVHGTLYFNIDNLSYPIQIALLCNDKNTDLIIDAEARTCIEESGEPHHLRILTPKGIQIEEKNHEQYDQRIHESAERIIDTLTSPRSPQMIDFVREGFFTWEHDHALNPEIHGLLNRLHISLPELAEVYVLQHRIQQLPESSNEKKELLFHRDYILGQPKTLLTAQI